MVKRKGGKKKAVVAEGPQIKKTKVEDVVRVGEFIKTRRGSLAVREVDMDREVDSTWESVKVSSEITKAIVNGMGRERMLPLQARVLPHLLSGKDVMVCAKGGSGQTLAFLVPMVELMSRLNFTNRNGTGAILLVPTRELATETYGLLKELMSNVNQSHGLVIVGSESQTESKRLVNGVNMLVATPVALLDHLKKTEGIVMKNLMCFGVEGVDRIVEASFESELSEIVNQMPKKRMTMMSTTSLTSKVEEMAKLVLKKLPVFVNFESDSSRPKIKTVQVVKAESENRLRVLYTFLKRNIAKKVVVFFSSCMSAKFHYELFNNMELECVAIHGEQKQAKRASLFFDFCNLKAGVLLCTEVATRGLETPEVDWIVQYEQPDNLNEFIHCVDKANRIMFMRPEDHGMSLFLKKEKITVDEINIGSAKVANVQKEVEKLVSKNYYLNQSAKEGYKGYARAYMSNSINKYNNEKLDLKKVAENFGLSTPPYVDMGASGKTERTQK